MIRRGLSLALLFTCLLSASAVKKNLDRLRSKISNYDSGALPMLSSDNYTRYSVLGPRNYGLVVLFTVRDPKFQCVTCPLTEAEMLIAAQSYAHAVPAEERDLFFVAVDYETGIDAFGIHQLRSAPVIYYREPIRKKFTPSGEVKNPEQHTITASISDPSTVPTAEAVLKLAGKTDITITRNPQLKARASIIVAVLAAFLGAVFVHFPGVLRFPFRPTFYMIACISVYVVSISGMIYCLIRSSPLYGTDYRTGKPQFMDPNSGQYVLEGLLAGSLNLFAALGVILAVRTAKSGTPSNAVLITATVFGLASFAVIYMQIVELYSAKTPWYNPSSLVPPGFTIANTRKFTRRVVQQAYDGVDILKEAYNA